MNKIKNHSKEVTDVVAALGSQIYAAFIQQKPNFADLKNATGLSTNSIKSILKGETANIASYVAVARELGLTLGFTQNIPKVES